MNRLASLFRSRRLWGLTGTALVLYFVVFVLLGKIDVSGIMPNTRQMAQAIIDVWPHLPFFEVQKGPNPGGDGTYTYYTVPTRQLTPQELKQMGVTNTMTRPAQPR